MISDVAKGAANSIGSRVGMGTQDPQTALHIVGDDITAIRIERTNGGGRIWDVQVEPSGFNLQDRTAGTAPFVVRVGAETATLHIDDDTGSGVSGVAINRVGFGADHPVHVGLSTNMINDGNGAHCTAAGVWTDASSRVHKERIEPIAPEAAVAALQAFEPVTYRSKGDVTGEQYAGFIAEDVPDIVATADRKGVAAIEVVAVVTKVVQEQQATIEAQRAEIDELKLRLEQIEKLLLQQPGN